MSPLCPTTAWTNPPTVAAPAMPRRSQQLRRQDAARWVMECYELQNTAPALKAPTPAEEPYASAPGQGWAAFGALFAQAGDEADDTPDQFRRAFAAHDRDADPMLINPALTWERIADLGNREPSTPEFVRRLEHDA